MCIGLYVKCPLLLSYFNETSISSADFSKNAKISNFTTILLAKNEFFHADGRTDGRKGRRIDMMKLAVPFRNMANAPQKDGIACERIGARISSWFYNLFIVKHNLLPVNTTIILIIIVLVLIHN